MFITRNRYVWLESCTSAGVYDVSCQTLDGMGWREREMVLVADMPGHHAGPQPRSEGYQTACLETKAGGLRR